LTNLAELDCKRQEKRSSVATPTARTDQEKKPNGSLKHKKQTPSSCCVYQPLNKTKANNHILTHRKTKKINKNRSYT